MQTFAEFMAESFHSHARLVWDNPRRTLATATFHVYSAKVIVTFEERETNGPWYVIFEVKQGEATELIHSAFEILNGVFQAVEDFLEVREPDLLIFATKHDRLADIYQTYLRKEASTIQKLGYAAHRATTVREWSLARESSSGG